MDKSQCDKLLDYLKEFDSITDMQAFKDLHICRLSARIYDLMERGYDIRREMVTKKRKGKCITYGVYTLEDEP